jgi:hypothetical protein
MKGAHPSRDNLFRRRIRQINADFLQKPFRKRRISIKTKGFGNYADLALPLRRSFVALAFISPIFPNLHMTSPRRLLILVLLGISCCFGCETAPETSAASNSELKQLGTQYMDFFRAQNKAPADESELKEFITATMTDVKREILGITDINKLFISPRDGKPFVVRYGLTVSRAPPDGSTTSAVNGDIVAYEAEGKGGYRHVITSMGQLTQLSNEELEALVPGAQ